jgi:hypothetical protein
MKSPTDQSPLRANKRETIDWLKFTLEGVGERTHGYAFTDTTFAECWIWSRFGPDVASSRCYCAVGSHSGTDEHPEATQLHSQIILHDSRVFEGARR